MYNYKIKFDVFNYYVKPKNIQQFESNTIGLLGIDQIEIEASLKQLKIMQQQLESTIEYAEKKEYHNMTKEDLFDEMIKNKINHNSYDPWSDEGKKRFNALKEFKNTITTETYKNYIFHIQYSKEGGAGMGEYPPSFRISILHDFNKE